MDSIGRNQREAVNVIFRILGAIAQNKLSEVPELVLRVKGLDEANVNTNLIQAISEYLEHQGNTKSTTQLLEAVSNTPFESALSALSKGSKT